MKQKERKKSKQCKRQIRTCSKKFGAYDKHWLLRALLRAWQHLATPKIAPK